MRAMHTGKSILITGASSGIGLATARIYLSQGHRVFAIARNLSSLTDLQQEFPSLCVAIAADLTLKAQVEHMLGQVGQLQPYLDLIILTAGSCEYLDVEHWDASLFDRVMSINFASNVLLVEKLLPLLRASSDPNRRLVGISSMVVKLPLPRAQAYGASKAALEYFLNSLAVDLRSEGIAVSLVRPGFVKTPLTAKNDFAMPFMIDPNLAALRITQGIARKRRLIEFPLPLLWLMRMVSWLPSGLMLNLLSTLSRNKE